MALTAKQEKFVQGVVAGLSQRKAYLEAYPISVKWKDATVDNNAYKLMQNNEIITRYRILLNEHKEKAMWTREESVNTLRWLIERSIQSIEQQDEGYVRQGTSNAMISAIKELNELELLYPLKAKQVEKIESEIHKDETAEDKLSEYLDILGKNIEGD